jgi:acetyl-CoA carboxylase biotin carboxylase subunit
LFKKILVANRGEIALRILRAAADLDIETVLVYSQADAESMPVNLADESYCIGPPPASSSYLNVPAIINVALLTGADAVHPGYGFLAENAAFAEICREHHLKFIGPNPDCIRRMGDKATARATAKSLGVPTVPGSSGVIKDPEDAKSIADEIGYPVLIKATAGGGGKGMRVASSESELESVLERARYEAESAFGNDGVYLEKYISHVRHVEIQVFGDIYGNVVHLGERDCSIQRRHQKLIEEAPSPVLDPVLREQMGEAATRIANAIEYEGAGTVEFILDSNSKQFYFMEMNTRIQVEHPVTEEVTGFDLVTEQLQVASGEALSFTQPQVQIGGHAIEFRINAEDPGHNFRPHPGQITDFVPPGGVGVRVDSHAYAGYRIPPNYDSLIGKLIVRGNTRQQALNRSRRALEEFAVGGVETTIPLYLQILDDEKFQRGDVGTRYLEQFLATKASLAV